MALKKIYPWVNRKNDEMLFGTDLAERVADYLTRIGDIKYEHKDYCGVGLAHRDGGFVYGEVYDGVFAFDARDTRFADQQSFVAWLAVQSDESLCGRERNDGWYPNNQRITRKRLLQHIEGSS